MINFHMKTSLLGGAALGVIAALAVTSTADAATKHHKKVVHQVEKATESSEIKMLREEVTALQARLDAQQTAQAQTQAAAQAAQAQAASVAQELQTAQAQNADATAAVLASIPTQVATAVDAVKPKTDAIYYKGVKITLGGFAEADSIYRSRNTAERSVHELEQHPLRQHPDRA